MFRYSSRVLPIDMEALCPIIRKRINDIGINPDYDLAFSELFPGESHDKILTSTEMLMLLTSLAGRHGISDCIESVHAVRTGELKDCICELIQRGCNSAWSIGSLQEYIDRQKNNAPVVCTGEVPVKTQKYNDWLAENQDNISKWASMWHMSSDDYAPLGYIAGKGLIDIIEIAPIDGHTMEMSVDAAAHGQIEVVKWLHKSCHPCDYDEMARVACNNGHVSVVEFLDTIPTGDNSSYVSIQAYKLAAVQSNVDILKWAVENNKLSNDDMSYLLFHAMEYDSIESVKYLHKHGAVMSAEDVIMAAGLGHITVVQYACVRYILTNVGPLLDAARYHDDLYEWLRKMYEIKPQKTESLIIKRR